ncbi:MAG: SUMF1/EgtB/PvdO family nonheme iron enzyme [Anaerolineales bacterium]
MARLFISYRRQDDGVLYVKEQLKAAHYAIWFDTDNILLGDPDWQESIVRGIENSQGVVLCLSPRVLQSEPIRFELRTALSKGKPIFVFMIQPFPHPGRFPSGEDLLSLGLPERIEIKDLSQSDTREAVFARALQDLQHKGISPSPHQRRQRNSLGQAETNYLTSLVDQLGVLNLAHINPAYDGSEMPIEALYVPLQTHLRLVMEIEHYEVNQWWLSTAADMPEAGMVLRQLRHDERARLDDSHAAIQARHAWNLSIIEIMIEERREQLYAEKQAARRSRLARLDHAFEVRSLTALDAVSLHRDVLLVGEGGAGKSFFARYLAACLAGQLLPNFSRALNHTALGRWPHGDLLPAYIRCHDLLPVLQEHGWEAEAVNGYLRDTALEATPEFFEVLQHDLQEGYGLLILDGLERLLQVPGHRLAERRTQVEHLLNSLHTHYGSSRFVYTARAGYFHEWRPETLALVHLTGLATPDRVALAQRIYINRQSVPETAASNAAQELETFMHEFSPEFHSNPRFATLLATVFPNKQQGVLYRRTIDLLLDSWTHPSPGLPSIMQIFAQAELSAKEAETLLIDTLGRVAFEVLPEAPDAPPQGAPLRNCILQHLGDLAEYYGLNSNEVRGFLNENTGVLVGTGEAFRFAHGAFHLYFLAEHARNARHTPPNRDNPTALVRGWLDAYPQVWHRALLMLADLLVDDDVGRTGQLWDLLAELIGDHLPDDPDAPPVAAQAEAIWTACHIVYAYHLHEGPLRRLERAVFEPLKDWLLALLATADQPRDPQAPAQTDLPRRATLGTFLGHLGDPRPGLDLHQPDYWVNIPSGRALLGVGDQPDPFGALDSGTDEWHDVPAFAIARYPVTVAQYEAFVAAGGYQQERFWIAGDDRAGWAWCQGRSQPGLAWQDPAWHIPNHPVIGVTWYEASAYCRWLGEQLGARVRLPTILEWVRAARADTDQIFPFGNTLHPTHANVYHSHIGGTSAVGLFVEGGSPFGVMDLCGNVYEWAQDPIQVQRSEEQSARHYPLLGGSWASYPGFCRINARFYEAPSFQTTYWGFRMLQAPS